MSVGQQEVRAPHVRALVWNWSPGWALLLIVLLYLGAHVVLRIWETPILAKNDVQEAVAAQVWAWGYHPRNPPLHTWLLMGSYALFGPSLLAHVVLKYALLGGVYGFAYACARKLTANAMLAAIAAASMTLLGPLAWTVHTALTHTLLMAMLALATLWAAMRMAERGRATDYALFGLCVGLGLLAKYSFLLFLGPLIGAMLLHAETRRALVSVRMLVALATFALVLAPHAIWMAGPRYDFIGFLTEKQQSEGAQPYWRDVVTGMGAVLGGALTFIAPLLIAAPIAFWSLRRAQPAAASVWQRVVVWTCALGLGLLVVDVLVLRATQFELRYFTCSLIAAPLALIQWVDRRGPSPSQLVRFCAAIALVAFVGFGGLAGRALLAHESCNRCWEEMPVDRLTRALHGAGFTHGTIVADHYNLAGNMRLAFPHARTIAANYPVILPAYEGGGRCALVWNARVAGDAPPPAITQFMHEQGQASVRGDIHYVEGYLRRSHTRMDKFAYIIVPDANGRCEARS